MKNAMLADNFCTLAHNSVSMHIVSYILRLTRSMRIQTFSPHALTSIT